MFSINMVRTSAGMRSFQMEMTRMVLLRHAWMEKSQSVWFLEPVDVTLSLAAASDRSQEKKVFSELLLLFKMTKLAQMDISQIKECFMYASYRDLLVASRALGHWIEVKFNISFQTSKYSSLIIGILFCDEPRIRILHSPKEFSLRYPPPLRCSKSFLIFLCNY